MVVEGLSNIRGLLDNGWPEVGECDDKVTVGLELVKKVVLSLAEVELGGSCW